MANYDLAFPGAAIDAILTTAYDLQNAGYIFKGSATNWLGTPTQRTWLLAPAGFSGYGFSSAIPKGSIGICKYNGSSWSGDLINVVTIDNYPTYNSTNAVTSGGMWQALDDLADGIWDTLQSFVIQDGTASANQATQIKFDVKMTDGQQVQHLISSFGILAATTAKAGLMSAADKAKVDAFLDNLRSLSFTDTTSGADVGTKIVETLKMTVGGVQEAVTALTILAATTSKAGLMSAADKTYLDGIPSSLSTINTSISKLLAMLGYYECSTAAATAAKEVSASGYVLTNGGCIRIKMTNANTADSVTLNINSTGAKDLYYDGAQASASNSWEAGDILEVFYDGTQYQCASYASVLSVLKSTDPYESDLSFCDNNGYSIVDFTQGHVRTKNFFSKNAAQLGSTEDDFDFAIADENDKAIVFFRNGHVITKNFNSSQIGNFTTLLGKYSGKKISILGDSISTYGVPGATNQDGTYCYSYYPTATCRYSQNGSDSIAFNVNDTYWMRIINMLGATLGINESWRGTKVAGSDASAFNNQTRINHLGENGTPDLILVFGGTNDAGNNITIGTFNGGVYTDYDTAEEIAALPVSTFADAYKAMLIRLMFTYPTSEIVCILPTYTTTYYTIQKLDDYVEVIKEACDFFGIKWIDTRVSGITIFNKQAYLSDGIHPNAAGMALIANKIYKHLIFD